MKKKKKLSIKNQLPETHYSSNTTIYELAGIYANKLAADKLGGYAWIPAVSAVRTAIIDSLQTLKSND